MANEAAYRTYFEHAPISIWVEDFSRVADHVSKLRAEGVEDFRSHFEDPAEVLRCISEMEVVEVNAHTLEMYGAADQAHLLRSLTDVFPAEAITGLADSLAALAEGKLVNANESVNLRLDGTRFDVAVEWAVMPGHEKDWARVLVSIRDITERKGAERAREKLVSELQDAMAQIKVLSDLIPICASCKKVRDDEGFWQQVEDYLHAHAGTRFSHGMCPDCLHEWYGSEADDETSG
jgi:PAS domain S-box-containing protein